MLTEFVLLSEGKPAWLSRACRRKKKKEFVRQELIGKQNKAFGMAPFPVLLLLLLLLL
jgi:hypothetical protein